MSAAIAGYNVIDILAIRRALEEPLLRPAAGIRH
ncbi:hypothetical protein T190_26785 [Sinorhizobium meliloti CCBAU 01290]|nr:hypothetical protein T190_26785 [Sinorhizobium meliloti CCBAU 01290]